LVIPIKNSNQELTLLENNVSSACFESHIHDFIEFLKYIDFIKFTVNVDIFIRFSVELICIKNLF
jgi:hypothetical protein